MVSARETDPVTKGYGCYWDQHVVNPSGEPTSPKGSDSQSETRKGWKGNGEWVRPKQGRTKPPASGGRKTGSPDCKSECNLKGKR